ncbi:TrmB family transcriptional regulator [Candidatus Uhrbacteria bacterium]|nr:TrmB family transcriptional regulator [Candidatus Uhrbacteria bacterium]
MGKITDLLQHFSLSPQEADLYILLLRQGSSNVSQLAHLQKRNRAAVYFHLDHLLERGLVKETRVGRRAYYVALPPKELATLIEGWVIDFKSLIPELESLQRAEQDKPLIEVIESSAGMKRIYDEITVQPIGSPFLVLEGKISVRGELNLLSTKEWEMFFKRMVERKILTRAVFTQESMQLPTKVFSEENKKLFRQRLWDLRSLPELTMPLEHLMMLYGNKAAFFIPESKLLFTLEHPGIVGILRALFETIHALALPVKSGW